MRGPIRRLLARVVPPEDRESVLGDLEEEYVRHARPRLGSLGAGLWYAWQAGGLTVSFLAERVREGMVGATTTRGGGGMDGWLRDLRQGWRMALRKPGATTAMVMTLALAVGAGTAMFSVVHAAFLRDLPYPHEDRLVRIFNGYRGEPDGRAALAPPDWKDVESLPELVEAVGVYQEQSVHLLTDTEPLRVEAARSSASLLELLGMTPILGRRFRPEDEVPGQDRSVILSHRLWVRQFGADSAIVGSSVVLDEVSYDVIGVAPPDFRMPRQAEIWTPLALGPEWFGPNRRGWEFLYAVGRLSPGVTPALATRELSDQIVRLAPERVESGGQNRSVVDLREYRIGAAGHALLFLLGAVGLVLLVACVNITTLLLARAEDRVREFALRRTLGSGAGRLSRLVLMETGVLALLGGLGGAALAGGLLLAARRRELEVLASIGEVGLSGPALAFCLAVTSATALIFGLGPALRAIRTAPAIALAEGPSRGAGSRRGTRLRHGLVAGEVALALVLLVGVGTTLESFRGLVSRDPGFRPEGVVSASLELPPSLTGTPVRSQAYRTVLERVRALPGVESAGLTLALPLTGTVWSGSMELEDPTPATEGVPLGGNMRVVSDDYFRTMGIPVLEGRSFRASDGDGAPVAVVDRTVARRAWPDRSPVGRRFFPAFQDAAAYTVVGVVGDVKDQGLQEPGSGHIYLLTDQHPPRGATVVARVAIGDPMGSAPALIRTIQEVLPRAPVFQVRDLEQLVDEAVAGPRLALELMLAFGLGALLLAAVGVYGVLSYSVARRTREIGTRVALGARPADVVRMVVRQGMVMWLVGTLAGLAGAVAAGAAARSLLFDVDPTNPVLLGAVAGILGLVALAAGLVPALRAGRIDCAEALRYE